MTPAERLSELYGLTVQSAQRMLDALNGDVELVAEYARTAATAGQPEDAEQMLIAARAGADSAFTPRRGKRTA